MARKADMQRRLIEQQRDQLLSEIEAIKNKIIGLEMALSLMVTEDKADLDDPSPHTRGGLKQELLRFLREAGTTGLNAATAIEVAQRRNIHLDKQSVSSTLSRMKADGLLTYDGDRYRLVEFSNVNKPTSDVVHIRPAG